MKNEILKIPEVKAIFENEFSPILEKFSILTVGKDRFMDSKIEYIANPGCYVWWNEVFGVLKVGRSFSNSRKRALEHIRDNTGEIMSDLANSENTFLILFNMKRAEDIHWVAAVEVFLEKALNPKIESERLG